MKNGRNLCPGAASRGISLLHGNCMVGCLACTIYIDQQAFSDPADVRDKWSACPKEAVLRSVFKFFAEQVNILTNSTQGNTKEMDRWNLETATKELSDQIDEAVKR
jgi:hypothetical protein